jgi:NAD(P)H-flavin reductase
MSALKLQSTVTSFRMLTPTVFELKFRPDHPIEFKGGQFVSVMIPGAGPKGRNLRRAYSIASPPENPNTSIQEIELCVKIVDGGSGSTYLSKLRPGDQFEAAAPYGAFVYQTSSERNACFISTGTGVAPFRSIVFSKDYQAAPPKKAWCLFGARTEDEILYDDEFSKVSDVEWVTCVSRPTPEFKGFKGRVTDILRNMEKDFPWKETDFYLCGNGAMITETKDFLMNEKGVEKSALLLEVYFKPEDPENNDVS